MKEKKPVSKTNWAKVDATPGVPDDEIPEVTDEMLDRAVLSFGGMVLRMPRRRGRPAGSGKKQAIKVRIDKDILAGFRATGPGWQTRINDALRRSLKGLKPAKRA
jgi:uncharacterized protein (DUF4415 family)